MFKKTLLSCFLPVFCHAQLSRIVEDWKNDKSLKSASVGFCVQEAKTSSVVSSYNSETGLIPASTLKVVTTSAALGLLGAPLRNKISLHRHIR